MKYLTSKLKLFVVFLIVTLFASSLHTSAGFIANNLMDDGVFDNYNSMSADQIDSWLNSTFPSSCISSNNGFTSPDPTGYTPSTGFTFGSEVSAGTVIAHAAQVYGLNPRVIISTLQKESSLVSGSQGCPSWRYASAMGYGCTDAGGSFDYPGVELYSMNGTPVVGITGSCVNKQSRVGFSRQVIVATWQLKFDQQRSKGNVGWNVQKPGWDNTDDLTTNYNGWMTQGVFHRNNGDTAAAYDGWATIDGSPVHIDTGPTAALYNYTPHFAGNLSFDNIYQGWFGSIYNPAYSWVMYDITISPLVAGQPGASVYGNRPISITFAARNTGNVTWTNNGANPVDIGTAGPTDHASPLYVASSWISNTRPARLTESSVAPGNIGHFSFTINPPNRDGAYNEYFSLVSEGASWFDNPYQLSLNVIATHYSWQVVSQTASNGLTLTPGQTSQITIVAKNTGNIDWSNSTNPVKLATWSPPNHSSAFCDSSWATNSPNPSLGCIRPALMTESSVSPGSNGTFTFTLKAPATNGSYSEKFNLVSEGSSWFEEPATTINVTVGTFYTWQLVGQTYGAGSTTYTDGIPADPGDVIPVTVTVKNTGNVTWSNTTNPVKLATWNPPNKNSPYCDSNWAANSPNPSLACIRAATLNEATVAPGANGTFSFNLKAGLPGNYGQYFNLVSEGAAWFSENGIIRFNLNVRGNYGWQLVGQTYGAGSTTYNDGVPIHPGDSETVTIALKNTGNTTWKNSGSYPIKLATWDAPNRTSAFCDSSWATNSPNPSLPCIRPALLTESSVAPGATGHFTFIVKAPSTAGNYGEYFNLVSEGAAWFPVNGFIRFNFNNWP